MAFKVSVILSFLFHDTARKCNRWSRKAWLNQEKLFYQYWNSLPHSPYTDTKIAMVFRFGVNTNTQPGVYQEHKFWHSRSKTTICSPLNFRHNHRMEVLPLWYIKKSTRRTIKLSHKLIYDTARSLISSSVLITGQFLSFHRKAQSLHRTFGQDWRFVSTWKAQRHEELHWLPHAVGPLMSKSAA